MASRIKVNEAASAAPPPPPPTPSESLIQQATKAEVIDGGRGRKLAVRKPGVLAQFKLTEALGETASNQTYMSMCMPLIYLGAIDGDAVMPPANKREIEALILRLDDDGLAALMGWYMEHIVAPTMKAMDDAERRASLKN